MPSPRRRPIAATRPQTDNLPPVDFGPDIRRRRGEVAIEDAADPDAPRATVRRGRVAWVPDQWLARGVIDQRLHAAATRLVTAYEIGILGARDRPIARISWGRTAPAFMSDVQLDHASDYQRAMRSVGPMLCAALSWCVLSTGTLDGWAECKRWDARRAAGYLMAALDRLADHYEKG
jgi:hypothetical protein